MDFIDGLYRRREDVKIIRTRHEVTVKAGVVAGAIKKAFEKVPSAAAIIDIDKNLDGDPVLVFEVEEVE